jgi:hypothetical protein
LAILHKDLRDLLEMQNEAGARTEKLEAAGGPRFHNPASYRVRSSALLFPVYRDKQTV